MFALEGPKDIYPEHVKEKNQKILDAISAYQEQHGLSDAEFANLADVSVALLTKYRRFLHRPGYYEFERGSRERVFCENKPPKISNIKQILDALKLEPALKYPKTQNSDEVVIRGLYGQDISKEVEKLIDSSGPITLGRLKELIELVKHEQHEVEVRKEREAIVIQAQDSMDTIVEKITSSEIRFSPNGLQLLAFIHNCFSSGIEESKIVVLTQDEMKIAKGEMLEKYLTQSYLKEVGRELGISGRLEICDAGVALMALLELRQRSKIGTSTNREFGKIIIPIKPLSRVEGAYTSVFIDFYSHEIDKYVKCQVSDFKSKTFHAASSIMLQIK